MNTNTKTKTSPVKHAGECPDHPDAPHASPPYHLTRGQESATLHIALPGVTREALSVSVREDLLTVTGDRHFEAPGDWACHRSSSQPGGYQLRLRLHPDLDPTSIQAELAEGILTLSLSQHESARARQITVN